MKHKEKTCIRRTAASKASKEERASLARSDGQEGEGMRGNQGRREPSQGGAMDKAWFRLQRNIDFHLLEGRDKGDLETGPGP